MATETVLTEKDRQKLKSDIAITKGEGLFYEIVNAVEQAVLQSPEVLRLKVDAERYRWATALEDNAETLYGIVLSHGGDQEKIDGRVDSYRPPIKDHP